MKKSISILLALGILAAGSVSAYAGGGGGYHGHGGYYGHHGSGVGGFLFGLVGGAIVGTIIANSQAQAAYSAPPREYVPPERVWVPGRYEARNEREWVPGHWAEDRYSNDGRVWVPGHYENVRVEVWVPGHWEERG